MSSALIDQYEANRAAFAGLGTRFYKPVDPSTPEVGTANLAERFARRVCGKYNKHVTFLIEGEMGQGKSYTAIELAECCSNWIAKLKGGVPKDYFDFDHISILDPESLKDMIINMKRNGVYIFDDAGVGAGNRDHMSQVNKGLSKIMQTCRTGNNILIFTVPSGDYIDLHIRETAMFRAEIYQSLHKSCGITVLKVFRQQKNSRVKRSYTKFIHYGGKKVTIWESLGPSLEIRKRYEVAREIGAEIVQQNSFGNASEPPNPRKNRIEKKKQEQLTLYGDDVFRMVQEGVTRGEIAARLGIYKDLVSEIAANFGFVWRGKGRKYSWQTI